MEENKPRGVDPGVLTECFAIYSRVQSGVTRYLRDESDTYSPMMNKLREDKCTIETVINGFLAVQRLLGLRGLSDDLFAYTDRVLFMLLALESVQGNPEFLPFMRDPATDMLAASFFQALSQSEFEWKRDNTKSIEVRMRDVIQAMEPHIEKSEFYFFDNEPFDQIEEPTIPKDAILPPVFTHKKTVH